MSIGKRIKKLRTESGLTQKELADKLHVTYQAVSRWENDDAEPSITTIKEICDILSCSYDELLNDNENNKNDNNEIKEVVNKEQAPISSCSKCNKFIYNTNELHFVTINKTIRTGKRHHTVSEQITLCDECYKNKLQEEKRQKELKELAKKEEFKRKRKKSFILGTIVGVIFLILSIISFVQNNSVSGISFIVLGALGYLFTATVTLNNTFIPDLWLEIASFGFIKLPGIIFEASLDGLVFLIVMKIFLFVLAMVCVIFTIIAATIIAAILSIFIYPYALRKNLNFID